MQTRNESLSSLQQKGQIHKNQQLNQKVVNDHYSFENQTYKNNFSSDSEQDEYDEQHKNKNSKAILHDHEKEQSQYQNQAKYLIDQRINLHKRLMEEQNKIQLQQKIEGNSIESSDRDTSSNFHQQRQTTQLSDQTQHKTSQLTNNHENQGSPLSFITSTINYDHTNNIPNESIPQTISKSMLSEILERDKIINEKEKYNQELLDKVQDYEFLLMKSTEELRKKQDEIELYKQNIAINHQSNQDNNSARINSQVNLQNESLLSEISQKQEIINNIEQELRKKDETINKAHEIIKKITMEIQQRNQQFQEMSIEIEQVQKKKQEYKKKYGKFKQEAVEQAEAMCQLQNEVQNKQQQNEQLYVFKDSQLKKKDQETQLLQSQIKQFHQENEKSQLTVQENKDLKDEIESLKIQLNKMQTEKDELSNNIESQQQQQEQQFTHLKNEFQKTLQFYKQNGTSSNQKYDESFNNLPSKNTSDFSCTEFDTCQIVLTKPINTTNTKLRSKPSSSQQQNSMTYDKKIFEECEKIQQSIFLDILNRLQQRTSYINQLMEREDNELKSSREQKIQSFEELDKTMENLQTLIEKRNDKIKQLEQIIDQMSQKIVIYKHINEGLSKNFSQLSSKYQNLSEIQQQNNQNLTEILVSINENQVQEQDQHNQLFNLSQNELVKIQKLEQNKREQQQNEQQFSQFIQTELDNTLQLLQKELDISQLDSHRYLINQIQNPQQQEENSDNLRSQIQLKLNQIKKNILQTKLNQKDMESDRKIIMNSYSELETQLKTLQLEKKEQCQVLLEEKKKNDNLEIQIDEIKTQSQITLNTERNILENRIKCYEDKNNEMLLQYKQQFKDLKEETYKKQSIIDQLNNQIQSTQQDDLDIIYDKLSARKYNQSSTNNLSTSRINQDNTDSLLLKELSLSQNQTQLEKTIKQELKINQNQNKLSTQKTSNTENDYSQDDEAQIKSNPQFKQLMKDYKEKMKQSFQKRVKELEVVLKFVKEIIKGFDFSNLKYKINCSKKVKQQEMEDTEVKVQLYMNYKESLQKNPNLKNFIDDITSIVNDLYEQNYFFLTGENGKIPLTLNPLKIIQLTTDNLQEYSKYKQKVNSISEQLIHQLSKQRQDMIEQSSLSSLLNQLTGFYKEKPINLVKNITNGQDSELIQQLSKQLNTIFSQTNPQQSTIKQNYGKKQINFYLQNIEQIIIIDFKIQIQKTLEEYFDRKSSRTLLDQQITNQFKQQLLQSKYFKKIIIIILNQFYNLFKQADQNNIELLIGNYFQYLASYKNRGQNLLDEIHNIFKQQIDLKRVNTNYEVSKLSLHIAQIINMACQQFYF